MLIPYNAYNTICPMKSAINYLDSKTNECKIISYRHNFFFIKIDEQ